jgi:hypothetical protein
MAMALGPQHGPVLLLYNRLDRDAGRVDVAAEVKYSAYVLLSVVDRDSDATLGQWSNADPVAAGQVTSQLVKFNACSTSWVAEGTFTWRSTQLRLAWAALRPC